MERQREMDWIINGSFSDFPNAIINKGFDVQKLRKSTPITCNDVKEYNVLN